jgi:phosphoribosylglycinamide formyltransferase-1
MRARLVVLVSGEGTNLQALIDACADESYGAEVVAVGADRDGIGGLARAQPKFLDRHGGRCVNTHPALLPSFPGMHGVRDALDYGVKVSGCTVLIVDHGVDAGPVVAQRPVPVLDDDDEASLHERIKVTERVLLVETVGRMVREGWSVRGRKVRMGS